MNFRHWDGNEEIAVNTFLVRRMELNISVKAEGIRIS